MKRKHRRINGRALLQKRNGRGLQRGVKLVKVLGKGANNTVYLARTIDKTGDRGTRAEDE